MGDISSYGTRTSVTGMDRIFVATGASPEVESCTLSQAVSLAGGGGGASFTRPALSAFTVSNANTLCTATDIAGGPIVVDYGPGGTYENLTNWNQAISGPEWMLTACVSQSSCPASAGNYYATLGIGVKSTADQLLVLRFLGKQQQLDLITWANETTANDDLSSNIEHHFNQVWYRIYYQSSNTAYPYTILRSLDGYTWAFAMEWDGTTGVSAGFTAASALFYVDSGGTPDSHVGGCLWHWDLQTGSGASLNPYSAASPR